MFFEDDWIMRQIDMMAELVARLVFHKDTVSYQIEDAEHLTDTDALYKQITSLLTDGKICEAENLLYENENDNDPNFLALALDFYQTLAKMSDEELERCNFSRQEVYDGLKEILYRHHSVPALPFEN